MYTKKLYASKLQTPLGQMLAVCDDEKLYELVFLDEDDMQQKVASLQSMYHKNVVFEQSKVLDLILYEIDQYFSGKLQTFTIALHFAGTTFQNMVWRELVQTPYGQTRSYLNQAQAIGKASSVRAVANANGKNRLVIVVPCHRIINSNEKLGGYSADIGRKKWLLEHEQKYRGHSTRD